MAGQQQQSATALARPASGRWARRTAHAAAVSLALLACAALPSRVAAHSFPYVPTQILPPSVCFNQSQSACFGQDLAYIFTQTDDDSVQFLSLNISGALDSGSKLETVTSKLPFLGDGDAAFGAARTGDGAVMVLAGKCDEQGGQVWKFGGSNEGGDWLKKPTSIEKGQSNVRGPYFLGGTLAFSSTLVPEMDEPTIYTYGGMCAAPQPDSSAWQSKANYTTSMLSLTPASMQSQSTTSTGTTYTLGVASSVGPRRSIAGFTLTAMQSSMNNNSGTVTQQTSYVVLGGHTQQAFINMSTAAVWNLPEETWSYVNIQQPGGGELTTESSEIIVKPRAKRASADIATSVDPRSGHTAVLSEDGRSIVVLGGWVGDVETPAEPQLAILQLSQAYNSWQWRIPKEQPKGDGVYGHGAAILPGNVMMVYGGWPMRSSDSSKIKRQASSSNSSPRFLNLTSMSWVDSYTNPTAGRSNGDNPLNAPGKGSESSKPKHLGLGLGLGVGLGLAALFGVLLALFFWRRKQRKMKKSRDDAIRAITQDASQFIHNTDEMMEHDGSLPWGHNGWYTSGQGQPRSTGRSLGYESIVGGGNRGGSQYGGYPPVTPNIARKPVSRQMRGGYVLTPSQLNTALVSPPGQIHPILEDDEEEDLHRVNLNDITTPTSEVHTDPFLTPTASTVGMPTTALQPAPPIRSLITPSPEGTRRHDPDVQDWVSDVDAPDGLVARYNARQGRFSPTHRSSLLSTSVHDDDERTVSNISESNRSAVDSLKRTSSGRWSNLAAGLFGGPATVGSYEPQKPGSSSSSSYNTAKSGFGALQAEAPGLLMGREEPCSPFEDDEFPPMPGSPSKSKPRRSWLGSLRRVFSNSDENSPAESMREESPRRPSMDQASADYESHLSGLSGELLRRKQGRQDWGDAEGRPSISGENDWDVERAVERRLVQVMFTVPKERLRVVNADDEDGDMDDEKQPLHQPQSAVLVDPDTSTTQGSTSSRSGLSSRHIRPHDDSDEGGAPIADTDHIHDLDHDDALLGVDLGDLGDRRNSHSTFDSDRRLSVAYMTAEAMTLERPRTRVLQMVDTIESRSTSEVRSQTSSPLHEKRSKSTLGDA